MPRENSPHYLIRILALFVLVLGALHLAAPLNAQGTDSDHDGMADAWEMQYFGTLQRDGFGDFDNDGLLDGYEEEYGTNPTVQDTDGDTLNDGPEVNTYHTDPTKVDTDSDGLNDNVEILALDGFATNPIKPDTDNDGLPDGIEVNGGAFLGYSTPTWSSDPLLLDSDGDAVNDFEEWKWASGDQDVDSDGDGISDTQEGMSGYSDACGNPRPAGVSSPTNPDTDGDGLDDGQEAALCTNPASTDTDGDTLPDGFEVLGGLFRGGNLPNWRSNPLNADTDGDGATDFQEWLAGSDPNLIDSDGDTLTDGQEINGYTDPCGHPRYGVPTSIDPDADGLTDQAEFAHCTDPLNADSDGDGLIDGQEVNGISVPTGATYTSDPAKLDTDGDTINDGYEVTGSYSGVYGSACNGGGSGPYYIDPSSPDTDGDGLTDKYEISVSHTNPMAADSDCDGLTDGAEIANGTDPLQLSTLALNPITTPKSASEGVPLTFTATAADPNVLPNTLMFSLSGAPVGANIDPNTGTFSWTPDETTGGNGYTFDVVVTENSAPNLSDSQTITVNVAETNQTPALATNNPLTLDQGTSAIITTALLETTDADLPTQTLTYTVTGGPSQGTLSLPTTFTQGEIDADALTYTHSGAAGTDSFAFTVTDGVSAPVSGTFTINITALGTPTLLAPADSSTVTTATPDLSWTSVTGAATFEAQFASDSGFSSVVQDLTAIAATNVTPAALANGTYFWRVRATNPGGSGPWTTPWSFLVDTHTVKPSVAPLLVYPTNALLTNNRTLSWQSVVNATRYEVQVDNLSTFLVVDRTAVQSSLSFAPNPALPDGVWYWRVRGVNAAGNGPWSLVWRFTLDTTAPLPPTLLSPANGSSTISRRPAFVWTNSAGAARYQLTLTAPGSAPLLVSVPKPGIGYPTYIPPSNLLLTTYSWSVLAIDAVGNTAAPTATWMVTIAATATTQPAVNLVTTNTPTLAWTAVPGAAVYEIQVDNNSTFSSPEYDNNAVSGNSQAVGPLPDGLWYWRVRAKVGSTWGAWSASQTFTVDAP